jgi:hypothetical protein
MMNTQGAYHGGVAYFSVVDPSETFSRDPEPYKPGTGCGSGVSEGSTTEKYGRGKIQNRDRMPQSLTPTEVAFKPLTR